MENTLETRGSYVCYEISRFMSENHITGTALAEAMKVTPQSVSNLLRKGKLFSPEVARRWVDGFASLGYQVNLSFLLSGEGRITDNPKHDRYTNYGTSGFKVEKLPENTAKANESLDVKIVRSENGVLKKRIELLVEENCALKVENKALKRKLAAIRRILEQE